VDGTHAAVCAQLKKSYGIDYRAPCDATHTGLQSGKIDRITSTNTLEHIPKSELKPVMDECHRLLSAGGVISLLIDYADHYAYFDSTISPYNYLQYSDRTWALFNSSLHYQNRLRHRDYLNLLGEAGFRILEEQRFGTNPEAIQHLSIDRRFSTYTPEELAVSSALILAHIQK
jgi:2-polyprenyl-3-methyl-5-hydroxy-6-metoxy-1,4-benzoquinol methylase